jgi:plasmid stabilization system protein ParE
MNDKSYKVIITPKAADMLIFHSRFIANVSEKAAMKFINDFNEKVKSLERFPERNPYVIDPMIQERKYRKLIILKRYILIYQIKDEDVFVDALLDCRQDYKWLL